MSTPRYKLTYFNFYARAETSRFMFHLAAVPYEDVRVEIDEWMNGKKKHESSWGVLPELEVDGKKLCQSNAIHYYLAKKFGYAGKDELENAKVLEFLLSFEDIWAKIAGTLSQNDPNKKHELFKSIVNDDIKPYHDRLTRQLNENGTGYFVGDQMTAADIYIFVLLNGIEECWAPGLLAKYSKLKAFADRIESMPKIREWMKIRPRCPFSFVVHKVDINE